MYAARDHHCHDAQRAGGGETGDIIIIVSMSGPAAAVLSDVLPQGLRSSARSRGNGSMVLEVNMAGAVSTGLIRVYESHINPRSNTSRHRLTLSRTLRDITPTHH